MRTLAKPSRLDDRQYGESNRQDRGVDAVTRRRIRDDRLFGALCHAGIFLGIWGIATTAVIWAYRKDRSRVIRFQGAQALLYQLITQAVIFLGAAVSAALLLQAQNASGAGQVPQVVGKWFTSGPIPVVVDPATPMPLIVAAGIQILLGFVAFLLMVLCLIGLEPSYPVVGYLARKVLGLRTSQAANQRQQSQTPAKEEQTVTDPAS